MRSIVSTLKEWQSAGKSFAIARVVSTWGSAPRRPGATLAVSPMGEMVGSVSGGCIEGAVRDAAMEILAGAAPKIVDYGVDDESAWSVGLSCGGSVRVLIQRFPEHGGSLLQCVEIGERAVHITSIRDGREFNLLIRPGKPPLGTWPVETGGVEAAASAVRQSCEREIDGEMSFLHVFEAPARLIIVGGADIAVYLVSFADSLGFETILIDPRAIFTDTSRFSVQPDRIITAWPQEIIPELGPDSRTFAVLLTHDPKIDDPAVHLFLGAPTAYIGALGSTRTQEKRRDRLRSAGFSEADIERVHGPVGLDIGASSPSEIALSIMAEIVAVLRQQEKTIRSRKN